MTAIKPVRASVLVAAFTAAIFAVVTLQAQPHGAAGGAYRIDPVHSSVLFKIKHLNTTNFYGRFDTVAGSFDLSEGGSINVTIKTDSLDSANPKRDQHLKGPDFFSVKEFPEANFKSTSIKAAGEKMYEATGDLTMHGVTRPVTARVEHTGSGKGMHGNPIAGIEARVTIKRSDFGMKYMANMLGDEVELIVALEGDK